MRKHKPAKKKKKTVKRKKTRRRPHQKTASSLNPTVTISIQNGVFVHDAATLVTYPKGPAQWVVVNKDAVPYTVNIDTAKVVHHTPNGDVPGDHPFNTNKLRPIPVDAAGGDNDPADSTERIKKFKPAQIPDSYEYTLDLIDSAGAIIDSYDPDLDVIDPGAAKY
ncbi:MAG TPA: hypothetical protein VEU08_01730 [Vicinamibacterales bacterium]|nr:hypothetical protein [Vicinamibacterales bacterium]